MVLTDLLLKIRECRDLVGKSHPIFIQMHLLMSSVSIMPYSTRLLKDRQRCHQKKKKKHLGNQPSHVIMANYQNTI